MIHGRQVLFPEVVQHLQHNVTLETTNLRPGLLFLLAVGISHSGDDPLPQRLFVQVVVIVQPLLDRQGYTELIGQALLQSGNIPLLLQALWRHIIGDNIIDDIFPDRIDSIFNIL